MQAGFESDIFALSLKRLFFTCDVLCMFQTLSVNILRAALHTKRLDEAGLHVPGCIERGFQCISG